MKKNLLIVILFVTGIVAANAQIFKKDDLVGNLTLGLGNALRSNYYGVGYSSSVPAIGASLEYGVADNIIDKGSIGVGGYIGYSAVKYDIYKNTDFIIGARGSFHYPFVDKLDTYAGLMIAYDVNTWSGNPTGAPSWSTIIVPGFIGARYYFTDKIAGVAELGWGIAYLNIGISLKIK